MCYSAESSLNSFIIGSLSCAYLVFYSKNKYNHYIGLFLFSVVLMQLLEYLMWSDQNCGWLNDFASRSVILVLTLQLYTIFLGAYLYDTTIIPNKILKLLLIPITLLFLYFGLYNYFSQKKNWCSKPNENDSLQWAHFNSIDSFGTYVYYGIFIIAPFLFKDFWKSILIFIIGLITFISTRYPNIHTSSSRWCYFSSYLPALFVIMDLLKLN